MKILVSAFEPFDGKEDNQSLNIVRRLNLDTIDIVVLPVLFKKAFELLKNKLEHNQYKMILMLGEGPNKVLHLEHVALNIMHARIPDASGYQPKLLRIDDGPLAIETTLPLDRFQQVLDLHQIPYSHSYHAGTYVCNDLFYRMMRLNLSIPCGFIHVPSDSNQEDLSMRAIQTIITSV